MSGKSIPETGMNRDAVLEMVREFGRQDADWRGGKTWSLVYSLGEEHTHFLKQAHGCFFSENALNPLAFRSLKRFESEVVRMSAQLLGGDEQTVGVMTAGGTESCLLAVKTYRDFARAKRPWIRRPEMVIPESAHVAFLKAAHYFNVKPVRVPLGQDYRVDLQAVRNRINRNTILLLGSSPSYPHGVVDPIMELGMLAREKGLPLHVDGCLGGFMLPFVERLGYPTPPFDFRVPDVTSMSADLHKYGFAAKGASVLLYRSMDLLKHQFFVCENWSGGVFISPAVLGTRSGGPIAAAWATLHALGTDGYLDIARTIMDTTKVLTDGIAAIPGLRVCGAPHMSVFAYESTDPKVNMYAVGDLMEKRGWHVDRLLQPEALHAMVTPGHAAVADRFLADLRISVDEVRAHPELAETGGAALYGLMAHFPMRGVIRSNILKLMQEMYGPEGSLPGLGTGAPDADVPHEPNLTEKAASWFLKLRKLLVRKRA